MMNSKRNRGGRMNSGSRMDKRPAYTQDRPRRNQVAEKNVNIDGVYKNQRFTHVVVSLVGSLVQVQVKNGIVYEGVFRTYSPKGDIVLEVAHLVENMSSAPNRDQILPKLIIKSSDLVMVNAVNVDLDYAVKDTFTDTGISKFNGEIDKEMRDLQPWDSEGGVEIALDGDGDKSSSNGWDANEMFQTNALQFNVKSSYDDSLEQYTTKLERRDSAEYRRREEEALKLAAEIERNPQYHKHIAQENGEGDDEEAAFSSVVRPGESSGGPQKYIPPNKRHQGGGGGVQKPSRGGFNPQQVNMIHGQQGQQPPPPTQVSSQLSQESVNGDDVGRPSIPASTAGPTVKTSPVQHDRAPPTPTDKHDHGAPFKPDGRKHKAGGYANQGVIIAELKQFSSNFKLDDKDPSKEREKDRDYKDNVVNNNKEKLSSVEDNKDNVTLVSKDRDTNMCSEDIVHRSDSSEPVLSASTLSSSQSMEQSSVSEEKFMSERKSPTSSESAAMSEVGAGATSSQEKTGGDIASKSTLNPNAKEFVFAPKSFQPPSQQIPTPPRPATQSPIVQPGVMNLAQPVYPAHGQFVMPSNPPAVVINTPGPTQPQVPPNFIRPTKRATVSVKPESVQAQVQAAAGQPLIQSAQGHSYMYLPHNMNMMPGPPQPTGYQMGQMMPMPAAQIGQRGFIPTSVQGMVPSSMQGPSMEQQQNNQTPQAGQVFMSQQGPMPAHMTHNSQFTHPNHNIQVISNNSQTQVNQQMNPSIPTGNVTGHHPAAPSPVHSNPNQQSMNPGPHPPSSGTPQPPQGYPNPNQAGMQGHPPLQPSPHNPTSPQNMQSMSYHYNPSGHPPQMAQMAQGSAGGGHQFSVQQQTSGGGNMPTVTYSMQAAHSHHSPHHMQQIVMMPPHPHSGAGQMNHSHIHNSHPFQGHPMAGAGPMQQQLMSQSGVQGLPGQNPGQGPHPPHQMQHFLPQVQHPGGQHLQSYQASQ